MKIDRELSLVAEFSKYIPKGIPEGFIESFREFLKIFGFEEDEICYFGSRKIKLQSVYQIRADDEWELTGSEYSENFLCPGIPGILFQRCPGYDARFTIAAWRRA